MALQAEDCKDLRKKWDTFKRRNFPCALIFRTLIPRFVLEDRDYRVSGEAAIIVNGFLYEIHISFTFRTMCTLSLRVEFNSELC